VDYDNLLSGRKKVALTSMSRVLIDAVCHLMHRVAPIAPSFALVTLLLIMVSVE
jgi:hypothetical protein